MSGKPEARKINREAWLTDAVAELTPMFAAINVPLPPVRVSVGWPGGKRRPPKGGKILGQCWKTIASEDGVASIFISPLLGESTRVLDVLLHELVHASDDGESQHRGHFAKTAGQLGLVAPWTATTAGEQLAPLLQGLAEKLGKYPHAVMVEAEVAKGKQTTRMIKVACADCGYTMRTTKKWLEVGVPDCPVDRKPMTYELPDEGEKGDE